MEKPIPFTKDDILRIAEKNPTPFYVYDEAGIRASARRLIDLFSWNEGFKEYFAVKATPNPAILRVLQDEGAGADCSSLPELLLAEQCGLRGNDIMFTSNNTPDAEFVKARELDAYINLDDPAHIDSLERCASLPDRISFRYNPGASRTGNDFIGKPEESKYGMTRAQLFDAYRIAQKKGITRFGLHAMVASNELDYHYFVDTARMLFELALELRKTLGIQLEFVNLGGGIGIPYLPDQAEMDIERFAGEVRELYEASKLAPLKIFMECGRYITGAHGYLVTTVKHLKNSHKEYVGVDACMANLMRPGMYGAYHHITVLGKEGALKTSVYDVVGSLCENNDKFAINRALPELERDDVLVIHDVGAHGHAMGFNYNGKLRSAEFLLSGEDFRIIRRAETIEDHFATLRL